jgi:hypothetical protein
MEVSQKKALNRAKAEIADYVAELQAIETPKSLQGHQAATGSPSDGTAGSTSAIISSSDQT